MPRKTTVFATQAGNNPVKDSSLCATIPAEEVSAVKMRKRSAQPRSGSRTKAAKIPKQGSSDTDPSASPSAALHLWERERTRRAENLHRANQVLQRSRDPRELTQAIEQIHASFRAKSRMWRTTLPDRDSVDISALINLTKSEVGDDVSRAVIEVLTKFIDVAPDDIVGALVQVVRNKNEKLVSLAVNGIAQANRDSAGAAMEDLAELLDNSHSDIRRAVVSCFLRFPDEAVAAAAKTILNKIATVADREIQLDLLRVVIRGFHSTNTAQPAELISHVLGIDLARDLLRRLGSEGREIRLSLFDSPPVKSNSKTTGIIARDQRIGPFSLAEAGVRLNYSENVKNPKARREAAAKVVKRNMKAGTLKFEPFGKKFFFDKSDFSTSYRPS